MNKLPSKQEILDWISDNPTLTAKRDIAKAFGIKGPDRIELKKILRELEADGHLSKRKIPSVTPTNYHLLALSK